VFLSGTLVGSVMFAMLFSITFLLPLFMQELLGFTALQSGLALMPRTLIMMVVTPLVGRVYNKVSPRLMVALGIVLYAIGAYQMSTYTLDTTASGVVSTLLIQGVAFSCLFVPLTTVALATVPRHQMTDATGLNSLLRQIGGSVGLAIFASLFNRWGVISRASIGAHVTLTRPEVTWRLGMMARAMMARGMDAVSARAASLQAMTYSVMRQASLLVFDKLFLLSGILFLVVLPLLVFLKSPQHALGQRAGGPAHKPADVHVEI
jgi:DHA2 family multidrug resistance protein